MMSPEEIARIIFKDYKITNLNQEAKSVSEYIGTLDNKVVYQTPEQPPENNEYKPPKTNLRMTQRVNKYVHDGLDENNLKSKEKAGIEALIGYMHTFRFNHQINNFETQNDRDLFESSFIRYTYDKPD